MGEDSAGAARQLPLAFPQIQDFSPASFFAADSNAEARAWIAQPRAWPGLRLALHGDPGTGKTHLLHIFAHHQGGVVLQGVNLHRPTDLPERGAIAIDDADGVMDPLALLHLLNGAAERGLPVLLAGAIPPARWRPSLADLDSRLRAMTAVGLGQPEDSLLRVLLARLIADRQLQVDGSVQDYLLTRLPRSCAAIREAVARLDHDSLARGSRISRKVASDMLAGLRGGHAHADDFAPEPMAASEGPRLI